MKIRLTKNQVSRLIRESLRNLILEELDIRVNDDIYKNLAIQCERFGIRYSQYWLAAAAIAYGNRDYDNFMNYLIASTTAGGIDEIYKKKNGEEWAAKPSAELWLEINSQLQARADLVKAINPKMSETFLSKVRKFLNAEGDEVKAFDDAMIASIDDYLESIAPNKLQDIVADIARLLRKDAVIGPLTANASLEILTNRGNVEKALGKLVLITPPRPFSELSPEEQAALSGVEVNTRDKLGSPMTVNPLESKFLEKWSKVPEAEIIAISIDKTSVPLGLAYVLPTVLKDFETLKQENNEVALWNEQLLEKTESGLAGNAAWPGDFKQLSVPTFSDIFSLPADAESPVTLNDKWRFAVFRGESALEDFKTQQITNLISLTPLTSEERFKAMRLVVVDLRATLPPNKVYTEESLEISAKFECPSESVSEMIELAYSDLSTDINVACKLAMANSFTLNISVTAIQVAQMAIPKLLGLYLSMPAATIGAVATPELFGVGAVPAAVEAYLVGEAAGRILDAVLILIENSLSQIIPLAYATVYFARKKMIDVAGILLTRMVIQIGLTILQAFGAEFGLAAKKLGFPLLERFGKIKGWDAILVNIAALIIDMWLSIEQQDMLIPGSKEQLLAEVRNFLIPYKDEEFTRETMEKVNASVMSRRVADLLGIENLFKAFEQLRITNQAKNKN